jgi:thioredoxin 1
MGNDSSKSKVISISEEKQFSKLINNEGLVLVGFTSKDCPPCKKITPSFQEMSLEFTKIKFLSVDTKKFESLSDAYPETESIPCFIMFQSGTKIDTINTSREKSLREWIKKLER